MTSRILIVDPVPTNRIVLRVKLASAYYDVVQAESGDSALKALHRMRPDLVIAANALTDMTGQAFCADLKRHPFGRDVPVILVHNDADPAERLACLAAGADDIVPRPIDELVLLARLRSLLRARDTEAEIALRDDMRRTLGLSEAPEGFAAPGLIALVPPSGREDTLAPILAALRERLRDRVISLPPDAALRIAGPVPDVFVLLDCLGGGGEALSLLPQLRSDTGSRHAGLIYVADPERRRDAAAALDMGANDLLAVGPDPDELALRLRKLVARKRMADRLRETVRDGLRAAVTDPLTGLYNRRYIVPYVARIADRARAQCKPFALLLADVDYFKAVNDRYGHAAGDFVLRAVADRLRDSLRAADLVGRYGGEEFVAVMPDTNRTAAHRAAGRLCQAVSRSPVVLPDGVAVSVTVSIGVAIGGPDGARPAQALIDCADRALYAAKDSGRNRVILADRIAALRRREQGWSPPARGAAPAPRAARSP
jgi:two-component system cell cycle response regulator